MMLFVGGLACIAMEIFVLPGLGVFGIGGGVMVLMSIILASQTFIFPRNDLPIRTAVRFDVHDGGRLWRRLRGAVDHAALPGRIVADQPRDAACLPPRNWIWTGLESLVDWNYLEGKRGVTTTQLTPSGKARFGDDVVNVISDGLLVPRGTSIRVVQVLGNRVLVEPLEES